MYILILNLTCILKYNYNENLKEILGETQGGGGDWTKLHWISFEDKYVTTGVFKEEQWEDTYPNTMYKLWSTPLLGKNEDRSCSYYQFSSVQLLSRVRLFATPWIAAHQASCPSPTPGVHPDSRPLSWWCHPAISSSVAHTIYQSKFQVD